MALALLEVDPLPGTLASVGFAVLPAFDTFDRRLYPRLLAFFEEGLLRPMLGLLLEARGHHISVLDLTTCKHGRPGRTLMCID